MSPSQAEPCERGPGERRRRVVRSALAFGLVALAGVAGLHAWRTVEGQARVAAVCDAARRGAWERALDGSAALAGPGPAGRLAAECRCQALRATGRGEECRALLERILAAPEAEDWAPDPELAEALVRSRIDAGRSAEAAALAARVTRAHPRHVDLLHLELVARSAAVGPAAARAALEGRLGPDLERSLALRQVLAASAERSGRHERALELLGTQRPPLDDPLHTAWVELRTQALAALGRVGEVRATYEAWERAGGSPAEIRARYAIRLSLAGLEAPDRSVLELLRRALQDVERLENPVLAATVYDRLVAHLLSAGRAKEALRVHESAPERFRLNISRAELRRRAREGGAPASELREEGAKARLVFRLAGDAVERGTLRLAPGPDAPPDTAYEGVPLRAGEPLALRRRPGPAPLRWVFRDAEERTRASGTLWPVAGRRREVRIEPGPPQAPRAWEPPELAPADGRRRTVAIVLDCADWQLTQYLRARGELPVLDHFLETGWRAVLWSDPPVTAAAMESLVRPSGERRVSFLGTLHRLGLELAGLASVGRNPLAFLASLLPERANLFETVGAHDRTAVNLLFSHGGIEAGRNAERIGPGGRREALEPFAGQRPLTPDERERLAVLLRHDGRLRSMLETTAAELDVARDFAREGETDLFVLRVEPLDLLTHTLYRDAVRSRQDDGRLALLEAYRYIDARLGEIRAAQDADDVLVVMSDHGILTAMEHDEDALFVAVGGGVPQGRAEGRPHFRGVARVLASLVGVETGWPETGVAGWADSGSDFARTRSR